MLLARKLLEIKSKTIDFFNYFSFEKEIIILRKI